MGAGGSVSAYDAELIEAGVNSRAVTSGFEIVLCAVRKWNQAVLDGEATWKTWSILFPEGGVFNDGPYSEGACIISRVYKPHVYPGSNNYSAVGSGGTFSFYKYQHPQLGYVAAGPQTEGGWPSNNTHWPPHTSTPPDVKYVHSAGDFQGTILDATVELLGANYSRYPEKEQFIARVFVNRLIGYVKDPKLTMTNNEMYQNDYQLPARWAPENDLTKALLPRQLETFGIQEDEALWLAPAEPEPTAAAAEEEPEPADTEWGGVKFDISIPSVEIDAIKEADNFFMFSLCDEGEQIDCGNQSYIKENGVFRKFTLNDIILR